jgi:hypothetical protein
MTYTTGSTIGAADYNGIAWGIQSIGKQWGIGSGENGLGQDTSSFPQVAVNSSVTATEWVNLIQSTNKCLTHIGQSSIPLAGVALGDVIAVIPSLTASSVSAFNGTGITSLPLTAATPTTTSQSSAWGSAGNKTLVFTHTVTFPGGADAARYFFNAGGQIQLSFSHNGGTSSLLEVVEFNTVGTSTWVVPAGLTNVTVEMVGAGGGGGGASGVTSGNYNYQEAAAGGGGSSGGYNTFNLLQQSIAVSPGDTISIQIGAGGTGGIAGNVMASGTNGVNGGLTSILKGAQVLATVPGGLGGHGGFGGSYSASNALPSGGISSGNGSQSGGSGAASYTGPSGAGFIVTATSGHGTNAGTTFSSLIYDLPGGGGGGSLLGFGGNGGSNAISTVVSAGSNGFNGGGGGGGAMNSPAGGAAGGNGGNGYVKLTYAIANTTDNIWSTFLGNTGVGTIVFGHKNTSRLFGTGTPSILLDSNNGGYWAGTGVFATHFQQINTNSDSIQVDYAWSGASSNGGYSTLTLRTTLTNSHAQTFLDTVNGVTSVTVTPYMPSTQQLSNTWGIPTVAGVVTSVSSILPASGTAVFSTPGSGQYWIVPEGITVINMTLVGAGGGGGGGMFADNVNYPAAGGGSGYIVSTGNISVVGGQTVTMNIGAAGTVSPGVGSYGWIGSTSPTVSLDGIQGQPTAVILENQMWIAQGGMGGKGADKVLQQGAANSGGTGRFNGADATTGSNALGGGGGGIGGPPSKNIGGNGFGIYIGGSGLGPGGSGGGGLLANGERVDSNYGGGGGLGGGGAGGANGNPGATDAAGNGAVVISYYLA